MGLADEIQSLKDLHESGTLSDGEFQKAKARLIDGQPEGAPSSSPQHDPMGSPNLRDLEGVSVVRLGELPGMRRFPKSGDAPMGCTVCGHVWVTQSDLLNRWLDHNSVGGKVSRAGRKVQHAGNVMTPGIGWMLSGRSAQRINAEAMSEHAVEQALTCPNCGSSTTGILRATSAAGGGVSSTDEADEERRAKFGASALGSFLLHYLYHWHWMSDRRRTLRSLGVDTDPVAGALAVSPFGLIFVAPIFIALRTTARDISDLAGRPQLVERVNTMLYFFLGGLVLLVLGIPFVDIHADSFLMRNVPFYVGAGVAWIGSALPYPYLQTHLNDVLEEGITVNEAAERNRTAEPNGCHATTQEGAPCKGRAPEGSRYCPVHAST